jgi:branched-subunit amino acid aminotransferase/4-amino-4-deoxychorismate lyase
MPVTVRTGAIMKSQASSQLSSEGPLRILLNGHTPTGDDLQHPALINYGHFTSMQVRSGRVRGLHLHLERIQRSHRELFGHGIDLDHARDLMRFAVEEMPDSYLRAMFFEQHPGRLSVMTAQRPPVAANTEPVYLLPVEYQRPVAHIKHVGTFCKIFHSVQAERAGYDDALHISVDGFVSETTGANIGFYDGTQVVWPTQPSLPGVTWHLLETALSTNGTPSVREPVDVRDLGSFAAAFLTNSMGVAPIGEIGTVPMGDPTHIVAELRSIYDQIPWDEI